MTMQTALRPLDRDGIEALIPLCRAFCTEDGHPFDPDRVRAGLEGLLSRPHFGTTLVLHLDGRPVGYAVVTLGWSLEGGGLDALLDEVYLEPALRGCGRGSALVERAVDHARRLGASRILLEVEPHNVAARRLYERLGFRAEESQMMLRWLDPPAAAGSGRGRGGRIGS